MSSVVQPQSVTDVNGLCQIMKYWMRVSDKVLARRWDVDTGEIIGYDIYGDFVAPGDCKWNEPPRGMHTWKGTRLTFCRALGDRGKELCTYSII